MKIVTANGKNKVVMTRKEWEAIGKKAQWDAPTPDTEAPAKKPEGTSLPEEVSVGMNNEWIFKLPHGDYGTERNSADRPWFEAQERLVKDMADEISRGSGNLAGDALIRKIENLLAMAKIRSSI